MTTAAPQKNTTTSPKEEQQDQKEKGTAPPGFLPTIAALLNSNNSANAALKLPTPKASPAQVRAYFAELLTSFHGLEAHEAERLVAKWMYGRGSEVLFYDLETYRALFGMELGILLHGYVWGKIEARTSRGSGRLRKEDVDPSPLYIILSMMLMFATGSWWFYEVDTGKSIFFGFLAGFWVLLLVLAYCILYLD